MKTTGTTKREVVMFNGREIAVPRRLTMSEIKAMMEGKKPVITVVDKASK